MTPHPVTESRADLEMLVPLYRAMRRIRLVELEISKRYAEQKMRCPVHLSVGQEAIAVGVCSVLERADQAVSTHRCHAHYLAKGGKLNAMMAELYGKSTGCCGGRGGSMHLFDADAGLLLSLPIVASSIPVGVGAALGFALRGEPHVAAVFLGDASLEEGVWHESANFAARHRLPVVFVCENNLYSVYTHLNDRQPDRPLTKLAEAHGIPARHVDGNNLDVVVRVTGELVDRARRGEGPGFLLADTYRWLEHCGPNYDNTIGYRTEDEFKIWQSRCPVEGLRRQLEKMGLWDTGREAVLLRDVQAEIDAAFRFAEESPFPELRTAAEGVYA